MASLLASVLASSAFAKGPVCKEVRGKPPTCQCDPGFTAICVENTPAPTKTPTTPPTPTRTATAVPTVVPTVAPTAAPSPTTPPAGGSLTLDTQGDPSTGAWAIEAKTAASGVYVIFKIDGTPRDEWAKPFCSFGGDTSPCPNGSAGVGTHQVDVELRDATNNALIDRQTKTVVEGGPGPIPTTPPATPLPTRTVGPQPTATVPAGPTPTVAPVPTAPPGPAGAPTPPELPRALPNITLPTVTGQVRSVASGGNLQATLDAAQPGDVVELAAGATFNGSYVLKKKAGVRAQTWGEWFTSFFATPQAVTGSIWIRSSAWQQLPPQGTRVSPSDASKMAKISTPSTEPALRWDFGASNWYLTGIEITTSWVDTVYTNYGLAVVGMDYNGYSPPTLADLPDNVILDRVYIHGTPQGNIRRGFTPNGGSFAIMDSYVNDIHERGADNQAVGGWTPTGPGLIRNNYLQSCGEVIMFGGADTRIQNLTPSDITIDRNTIEWNPAWKTSGGWSCKNLTELKHAQRVLIEKNLYRHWWPAGQSWSFAWTVRNQSGGNPWAKVDDITFRNNRIEDVENGANTLAHDSPGSGGGVSTRMARFAEYNNVWYIPKGTIRQFLAGAQDTLIEHNTYILPVNGGLISLSGSPAGNPAASEQMVRLTIRNNIFYRGIYGVYGDNDGIGTTALNLYAPGAVFTANAMYDGTPPTGVGPSNYPGHPGNFFPTTINAVGFVDLPGGNYQLSPSSPYKGKGTDGKDLGVTDWAAIPAGTAVGAPAAMEAPVPKAIIGTREEGVESQAAPFVTYPK